jgi:hypothetical protein
VNTTASATLQELTSRRRFIVLGYSAEGSTWCPQCLRSAAGLSPSRGTDSDGKPILPLYAAEPAVQEETCGYCQKPLVDLLLACESVRPKPPPSVTATLRSCGKRFALSFEAVPPAYVRAQLKEAHWRWDSRYRVWWCAATTPEIPAGVTLPPDEAPRPAMVARPPIRRCATTSA